MTMPESAPVDDRKTAAVAGELQRCPALSHRPDGTVEIGSFSVARQLLRSNATRQAGFRAEDMMRFLEEAVAEMKDEELRVLCNRILADNREKRGYQQPQW